MNKATLNYACDAAAFALLGGLAATGFLMAYKLPPGSGQRLAFLGMNRHEWGDLHFWVAVGFLALVVLHLALHWRWIVAMTAAPFRRRHA